MNDKSSESRLGEKLKSKLKAFAKGFVNYLKAKEISTFMPNLFENMLLNLFVWGAESESAVGDSINCILNSIIRIDLENYVIIEIDRDCHNIPCYIKKQNGKMHFSSFSKVLYNNSFEFTGEFCVMWGIELDSKSCVSEKIMAEVLVDFLQKCLTSLDYLDTVETTDWEQKEHMYNFDIIDAYVKKVFFKLPIPSEEIIKKLSYQHYEGSDTHAKVYFVDEEMCKKIRNSTELTTVWFDKEHEYLRYMSSRENVFSIRKILEICKGDKDNALLVQTGGSDKYPIVAAIRCLSTVCSNVLCYYLEFCGRGEWKLFSGDEMILEYKEGIYHINRHHFELGIEEKVAQIDDIDEEKRSIFVSLFKCLNKCQHGALMILGDEYSIRGEVDRLYGLRKGTKIEKLDLSIEGNLQLVSGMASVDGAIMVDYNGICYGFAVILDGEAIIKGDVGRGSRYNSAKNYAMWRKKHAVVFSEDKEKGIEVINGIELTDH